MGIYLKMSLAYLKKNKLRTLLLILGIVLGVVLIFSPTVIKETKGKNTTEAVNKLYGGYHVEFRDLTYESSEKLKNDENTAKSTTIQNLGDIVDKSGNSFNLKSADEEYMERISSTLIEGRLPENNNEIVLDKEALKSMGVPEKLNSNLDLKIKKKYINSEGSNEIFVLDKTFKIVGITEKPTEFYEEIYLREAFTYGNHEDDTIIPEDLITYNNVLTLNSGWENISGQSENLVMKHSLGKTSYIENILLVMNLMEVEVESENIYDYKIDLLIVITSAIFVFNIFNITLNETISEMGLLRLIGTSKKNVRLIIIYQGIIVMVAGVLLGLAIGTAYSYLAMIMSDQSLYNEAGIIPKIYITKEHIISAIIPGIIASVCSCMIPIMKISKVSPISDINKVDKLKSGNSRYKLNKLLSKMFGFYGLMGIKNIFRNKARAIISMLSIALGGYVFIYTFSSMQAEVNDEINKMHNMYDVEMQFFGAVSDLENLKYTQSDIKEIKDVEGVKSIDATQKIDGIFKFKENEINDEFVKYNGIKQNATMESKTSLAIHEDSYINDRIKDFTQEGNVDEIGTITDGYPNVAVYNYFYDIVTDNKIKEVFEVLKIGDIITLKNPVIENGKTVYKETKVRVCAILKPDWIAYGDHNFAPTLKIYASDKNAEYFTGEKAYNHLGISLDNPYDEEVNKKLEMISKNIPLSRFDSRLSFHEMQQEGIKEYNKSQLATVGLVLAIAGINIYCTIRTNLIIRKKEISTFRAIGLSIKNMKKMFNYEAISYAVISFIITLFPTLIKLLEHVRWHNDAYSNWGVVDFMDFTFPVIESITFLVIAIFICLVAVGTSNKEFKNKSIIEGIKDNS